MFYEATTCPIPVSADTAEMSKSAWFAMPFGKHRGLDLEDVNLADPGYLSWVLDQRPRNDRMRIFQSRIRSYRAELLSQGKNFQKQTNPRGTA